MANVMDVRDVMGLDAGPSTPRQPPQKKQKIVERKPDGITRELYALLGDHAAPVQLVNSQSKFKKAAFSRLTPWEMRTFINDSRGDGLELSHWVRKTREEDVAHGYQFAKYNVKMEIPSYTEGEYETILEDVDWTRDETDYLFELVREYEVRWMVIFDRYEWEGKTRSMEDMKARYYSVCRSIMELRTPPGLMDDDQQKIYNALKYDKAQETERKRIAEIQLYRTPAEIEHEAHLIAELKRIHDNHEQLLQEREELFTRLDFPQATGSIAAYTGSQGLAQLAASLLQTDRNKKRKSIAPGAPNGTDADNVPSPTVTRKESIAQPDTKPASGHHHRDSTASAAGAASAATKDKKQPQQPVVRTLTKAEEVAFGVSHHEKLAPGAFARTQRMTIPKQTSYLNKSIPILAELGIPVNLAMPTARTVAKYEQLAQDIQALLETRKVLEKVENEIRVQEAQEALRAEGGGKRSASVMSDVSKSSKKPKKEK